MYKAEIRPDNNFSYYSFILCYDNDILCIHHNALSIFDQLDKYMKLKPSSMGDPDTYLGAKLKLTTLDNGVKAWGMSPSKFVQHAVVNCAKHLSEKLDNK